MQHLPPLSRQADSSPRAVEQLFVPTRVAVSAGNKRLVNGSCPKGQTNKKKSLTVLFFILNKFHLYIIMSPIQGYIDFGNFINIALTDYAIQYRPYGATRLQTNNPKGATLPSIVRKSYDTNGSTIQPQRGDITQHSP